MKHLFPLVLTLLLCASCTVSRQYSPGKKYAPEVLQKDYTVFKSVLEESHPGIYWYTPKDSMDYFFERGRQMLNDSLTEAKFRNVLNYVISKMRCGHTTTRPSGYFVRFMDSLRNRQFPLGLKLWPDTAVVTVNLNREDSVLRRGTVIRSIDGMPIHSIVDSLFEYLSADGYNLTHKYQTLSNRGVFSSLFLSVYGVKPTFNITYLDSANQEQTTTLKLFIPARDSTFRPGQLPPELRMIPKKQRKQMRLLAARNLKADTTLQTAFMELNTFTKHNRLGSFFRRSFRYLHKNNIQNLVIDLRGNGGGSVTSSNLLTKYIAAEKFRIADSLYAVSRGSRWGKYQQHYALHWIFLNFMTRKEADRQYHFKFFEKKWFKPKSKHHFNGKVYILTGGNTFSASTLFIQSIKHQPNVVIVGEETGGGSYGNNAWLLPDVVLPATRVRFRLPLFRMVIHPRGTKGFGVTPEVEALPTVEAIRQNSDFKLERALELIKADAKKI